MKLQQNQLWKQGDQYIRIVQLERLKVEYKTLKEITSKDGPHHHVTKKEFCRMLKGATLMANKVITADRRDEVRKGEQTTLRPSATHGAAG